MGEVGPLEPEPQAVKSRLNGRVLWMGEARIHHVFVKQEPAFPRQVRQFIFRPFSFKLSHKLCSTQASKPVGFYFPQGN